MVLLPRRKAFCLEAIKVVFSPSAVAFNMCFASFCSCCLFCLVWFGLFVLFGSVCFVCLFVCLLWCEFRIATSRAAEASLRWLHFFRGLPSPTPHGFRKFVEERGKLARRAVAWL